MRNLPPYMKSWTSRPSYTSMMIRRKPSRDAAHIQLFLQSSNTHSSGMLS
jgi:hypothetical protein